MKKVASSTSLDKVTKFIPPVAASKNQSPSPKSNIPSTGNTRIRPFSAVKRAESN